MTKHFGRFCINTLRNSENGFSIKPSLFPDGTKVCELFCDEFTRDWGTFRVSVHILKYRVEIEYRFGRKCALNKVFS